VASVDTTLYDTTQVYERPTARFLPQLTFPEGADRRRDHGRVVVTAIVNADGAIDQSSIAITQSVHPLLDAAARRFVSGATLWPACRQGAPVRVRIAVPIVFDMRAKMPGAREGFLIGIAVGVGSMIGVMLGGN
jgi:TonB family protein